MVKNDANFSLQKSAFWAKRAHFMFKSKYLGMEFTRKDRPFSKYVIKDAYLFYLVEGVHGIQL